MFEEELPKEEITRLRKAFALFDVDGDGSISTKVSFFDFARSHSCYYHYLFDKITILYQ